MRVLVRECKADLTLLAYSASIDFTVSIDMSWIIHLQHSVLSTDFTLAVKIFYTSCSRLNWRVIPLIDSYLAHHGELARFVLLHRLRVIGITLAIRAHCADRHWVANCGPSTAQMDGHRRPLESRRTRASSRPLPSYSPHTDIVLIGFQNTPTYPHIHRVYPQLISIWHGYCIATRNMQESAYITVYLSSDYTMFHTYEYGAWVQSANSG